MTVVKHIFTEYVDYIRHSGQEKSEYDTLLYTILLLTGRRPLQSNC